MPTKYTIKTDTLPSGTYTFKVKAKADGYADSDFSNIVTYTSDTPIAKLVTPTVYISNKTVSWNAITNASTYVIEVNGITYSTLGTSRTFSNWIENNTYLIRVKAIGDDINYIDSDYSEIISYTVPGITQIQLETPNLYVDTNNVLRWGAIANCNEYYIRITTDSGEEKSSDSTSDNYYSLSWLTTSGTYFIYVTAIGDGTSFLDSDAGFYSYTVSNSIKLATPTGLRTSDGYMYWDSVPNANYYYAEIDYYDNISYSTSYPLPTESGTYLLRVKAIGDGDNYTNSDYSSSINYVVDEPGIDLIAPSINTRTQYISIEDTNVWQGVFSFINPNQANVNIEYGYSWQTPPTTFDYSFNNVGFYANTIEVGVANNHEQTRTLFIIARIEYQGQYTVTVSDSIQVQPQG